MKTRIKILTILIAIFAVSLACGLLAGCIGEEDAKDRADKLGMTACVTYYTNGGNFVSGNNPKDKKAYRTDYYYPDTPIFNIGVDETTGQSLTIKRDGYVFAGWAYALLNDGEPVLYAVDDDGNTVGEPLEVLENGTASMIGSTGREMLEQEKRFVAVVDESRGLVFANGHPKVGANEHKYLVATWVQDVMLEYKLITDEPITVGEGEERVTYENGDIVYTRSFSTSTTINLFPETAPVTFEGFSYIHLYWDENGENYVTAGETVEKGDGESNHVIYIKFLKGNWTPVRTANDVANMLRATGNSNFFVVYDDIDCAKVTTFSYRTAGNFGGIIDGNNKTILNINMSATFSKNVSGSGSILGNLTSSAKIKNLKVENVSVSLKVGVDMYAYLILAGADDGAEIENVVFDNVTFDITKSKADVTIYNMQGANETNNWLYGEYATDDEFIEKYGNIVKNYKLIIDGQEIVSGGQL